MGSREEKWVKQLCVSLLRDPGYMVLSSVERAVFHGAHLLSLESGRIPNNPVAVARMIGLPDADVVGAWPAIERWLRPDPADPEQLAHAMAAEQLAESAEYREAQAARGRLSHRSQIEPQPVKQPVDPQEAAAPPPARPMPTQVSDDCISAAIRQASGHVAGPRIIGRILAGAEAVNPGVTAQQIARLVALATPRSSRVRSAAYYAAAIPEAMQSAAGREILGPEPLADEPERCAHCNGCGVIGETSGGTAAHIRTAVNEGLAELCRCESGARWKKLIEDVAPAARQIANGRATAWA